MTINVGPMQLESPESGDELEPYFLGQDPSGGYWTILQRLSYHDHSGGLLGAPISVLDIPDGSITAADLNPAVLAPYSLVDGSKPFTGQVTMQADAIVRDALFFGEQGTALAPDATLQRTGPGALASTSTLTLTTPAGGPGLAVDKVVAGLTHVLQVRRSGVGRWSAMLGPADELQWWEQALGTARMSLAQTGTLTLTPAVGAPAVVAGTARAANARVQYGEARVYTGNDGSFGVLEASGEAGIDFYLAGTRQLWLRADALRPTPDNTKSAGDASNRFTAVWAVAGAINTSSRAAKEGITPLDPQRAMQAVRATPAVTFDYVAPARPPDYYDLPDDPEQAQAVLEQRLTSAPLEAAARHQAGFVAEEADELFLVGEGQTSPSSTAGVLLAALQQLDQRVQALEGAP